MSVSAPFKPLTHSHSRAILTQLDEVKCRRSALMALLGILANRGREISGNLELSALLYMTEPFHRPQFPRYLDYELHNTGGVISKMLVHDLLFLLQRGLLVDEESDPSSSWRPACVTRTTEIKLHPRFERLVASSDQQIIALARCAFDSALGRDHDHSWLRQVAREAPAYESFTDILSDFDEVSRTQVAE